VMFSVLDWWKSEHGGWEYCVDQILLFVGCGGLVLHFEVKAPWPVHS
jgi:hypothetical protein